LQTILSLPWRTVPERIWVGAWVAAIRQHDTATTLHRLEALVEAYPTDHVATQVLSFVYSARGDKQRSLTQARRSLTASPYDPHFLTMTAFYLEPSNTDPDEGLELGLRALAADPGNLYKDQVSFGVVPA
jgi:hypothetical protein